MGKILRRCTICKKFHASYLVEDPQLGKCYLCYSCWKAREEKSADVSPNHSQSVDKQHEVHTLKVTST